MRRGRRGSALILALLVASLLLVAGTANLLEHRARGGAQAAAALAVQAEALAWAGMEDVRVKLERDASFPPRDDVEATVFAYTEVVPDAGVYMVTVDSSLEGKPWRLLLVTVTGVVGDPAAPRAVRTLRGEVDLREGDQGYFVRVNNFVPKSP